MLRCLSGLVLVAAFVPAVFAADKDDQKAPFPLSEAAPKKDWKWDPDERFDELMEQLAINEASLDAVQTAIDKKTRRKAGQIGEAKRQDDNTRMMDRKGGGPMKWDQFYGTNAEKFFYHPVDPNTTYRTDTFLRQMGKAEDDKVRPSGSDPSRQSVPVHQRPPQWDYIYKANETAKENALAVVAIAGADIERLEQRRTELEKEQAVLWCKLAFRAVQRLEIADKELLRCELVSATDNAKDEDHAKALAAATRFVASSLAVVEKAEQDQSVAFGGVASVVTKARTAFKDGLREVSARQSEWESTETNLGKFYKLSQMLADKARTLTESYAGAMDGDLNKEVTRKERFRGMLQESVVEYAQILLALNELADAMKAEWKVRVDTKQKLEPLTVAWDAHAALPTSLGSSDRPAEQDVRKSGPSIPKRTGNKKAVANKKPTLYSFRTEQEIEKHWGFSNDKWRLENGGVRFTDYFAGSIVSRDAYIGDFVVEVTFADGREIKVTACDNEFAGEGTYARLERRGDVLVFQSNKTPQKMVTLKQSQRVTPTIIEIGQKGMVLLQSVKIIGTVEEAE